MAIQNAASVAALLITTVAMVAEVPKKNAGGGGMLPGGGMGGMDFTGTASATAVLTNLAAPITPAWSRRSYPSQFDRTHR